MYVEDTKRTGVENVSGNWDIYRVAVIQQFRDLVATFRQHGPYNNHVSYYSASILDNSASVLPYHLTLTEKTSASTTVNEDCGTTFK